MKIEDFSYPDAVLPTLIRPMATGSGLACALDRDARDGDDVFYGDVVFSGDDGAEQ